MFPVCGNLVLCEEYKQQLPPYMFLVYFNGGPHFVQRITPALNSLSGGNRFSTQLSDGGWVTYTVNLTYLMINLCTPRYNGTLVYYFTACTQTQTDYMLLFTSLQSPWEHLLITVSSSLSPSTLSARSNSTFPKLKYPVSCSSVFSSCHQPAGATAARACVYKMSI